MDNYNFNFVRVTKYDDGKINYDDFELGNKDIMNPFTYGQIKAINALSYIRMHDKDFLLKDINWEGDSLCYIGWETSELGGDYVIRKMDALMCSNDIKLGNELLIFNDEDELKRFVKRYSESINMEELVCDYYRFEYED